MKKVALLTILALLASGCGRIDRWWSGWTGEGVETCHKKVVYLQFTSGSSVAYNPDGSVMTCKG